jgi:23S rRNA pseudouridine2457 synthase
MKCILFHKPYGVLTQFTPAEGHRTLKEYIPVPSVYPAGRLDHDSEGLLLLTDDGSLQHRLSDPRFEHQKTYWVQVERVPTEESLAQLASGVDIQDYRTKPAQVRLIDGEPTPLAPRDPPVRFRKTVPTAWLEVTIAEGKNRQIRHMTAAIGHPALRLIRTAIGSLELGHLKPGDWRVLSPGEVATLVRKSSQGRKPNLKPAVESSEAN